MDSLIINGGKKLIGDIPISGSKKCLFADDDSIINDR